MEKPVQAKSYKNYQLIIILFVTGLYSIRLLYCYLGYFRNVQWLGSRDEPHIYLIGLRYFLTGQFPDWGPDIIYSDTFLVGGMQGFLVGLPLFIWPHPFAPYLFLFLCLSSGLIYLSWYITKIFPSLPKILVYTFVGLAPFTIHTGLHVINPAYALVFAIPFMLSLIETLAIFDKQFIHPNWRFFWMGLGITSVFQIHGSWAFLFVLWVVAIVYLMYQDRRVLSLVKPFVFTGIGLFIGFLPLIHVLYHFGFGVFHQAATSFEFRWSNAQDLFKLLFYFMNQSGYEVNAFDNVYRWGSVLNFAGPVGAAFLAIVQITGYTIFGVEVLLPFWKKWRPYIMQYKKFLVFIVGVIILLTITYMFSNVRPRAHAIIILFPLSAFYLFWMINNLVKTTKIRPWHFGVFACFIVGFYMSVAVVTSKLPDLHYREKAFNAIEKKDPSLFETPRFEYPKAVR